MSAKNAVEERQTRRRRRRASAEEEIEEEEVDASLTQPKGHATPGRRAQGDTSEGNFITRPLRGLMQYFAGVRSELQKVTWPTRQETIDLTRIVLVTVIASAIALGVVSLLFSELFRFGLQTPIILVAVIVLASGIAIYYMRGGRKKSY